MLANRVLSKRILHHTANRCQAVTSRQNSSFSSLFSTLFSKIPKGFNKFYPKEGLGGGAKGPSTSTSGGAREAGAKKAGEKGTESTFQSSTKKTNKGGSGSGGNNNNDKDPFKAAWGYLPLIMASSFGLAFLLLSGKNDKMNEISWQEFQYLYLEPGKVQQVIVVNKQYAKVILKENNTNNDSNDSSLSFSSSSSNNKDTSASSYLTDSNFKPDFGPQSNNYRSEEGKFSSSDLENRSDIQARQKILMERIQKLQNSGDVKFFSLGSVDSFERRMDEAQRTIPIKNHVPVTYETDGEFLKEFVHFLPSLIILGLLGYTMRSMGGAGGGGGLGNIFKAGKSNAKMVKKESITTKFVDVAGCDGAKKEIMEFVEFLRAPQKFTDLGAKIPRGALLSGPPGTGKTLLAKATAGEADVPFFSISGSDFVEMFVGVGASRVRDLFKEARANAPCIVFIDEIDAVGRARGKGGQGGNDERENTLNQLLIEMDGFSSDANVIMLAGTNRLDMLDSALTRPGRFDRTIAVELPDIKGRKQIYDVHLKKLKLDQPIEELSPRLAALTPGFSGADIANICNEAAITAGRENATAVSMIHFEKATDRIIGGLESTRIISPEERKIVAYHEAGHAVAGWFLEHASPLLKVTIVPRSKGSLGYAQYLPKEVSLRTKTQIMDIVCMALAGRAAEQVHFGGYTTGASDDLNKVTQIIYEMVQVYGMNEKVGQLAFPKQNNGWPQDRTYSESTAEVMDEEVRAMVAEAYQRTIDLMEKHRASVIAVAELLLKEETISHTDVARLIGDRKFSAGKEYDEYLVHKKELDQKVAEKLVSSEVEEEEGGVGKDIGGGPILTPA